MTRREALAALLAGPLLGVRSAVALAQADNLTSLTIGEASTRLASEAITPLQLTNAYLSRIATMNRSINAYVTVTADLARRQSRVPGKGPMWGIPIAHKDLLETKGVRTTAGSRLYEDNIPEQNAAIVQALEDAGAVMLGKTNTHELGGGVTTINPFFGTTRNPVDEARIAGGSSGGSAAAVVAHLCAAATGSDTGGSVRIPAALCGCVGFKPTFGRISTRGLLGSSATFDHVGFLTRTVEDVQLMLSVTPAVTSVSPVVSGFSRTTPSEASPRIAVARPFFFDDLDPAVASAVNPLVAKYPDIDFPIDAKTMARIFDPVVSFEIWGTLGADWRTNPGSFSKDFATFFATPRPSIAEYESGLAALKEYQEQVDRLFNAVDVIVMPTVPVTAPLINGPIDGMKILRNTWPMNAAGTPSISIPLKTTGLPIGLQLIAKRNNDDKLLQVARAFI